MSLSLPVALLALVVAAATVFAETHQIPTVTLPAPLTAASTCTDGVDGVRFTPEPRRMEICRVPDGMMTRR